MHGSLLGIDKLKTLLEGYAHKVAEAPTSSDLLETIALTDEARKLIENDTICSQWTDFVELSPQNRIAANGRVLVVDGGCNSDDVQLLLPLRVTRQKLLQRW